MRRQFARLTLAAVFWMTSGTTAASDRYVFTTLAGSTGGRSHEDGAGSAARFGTPRGLAIDAAGNILVADVLNATVRVISPAGVVTTLAGRAHNTSHTDGARSTAAFYNPFGIAVDRWGNVYVSDSYDHTIRKITTGGVVTTLAGQPLSQGSSDGTGSEARFKEPSGLAVDAAGNLYVADRGNHTIRKVTPAGVVTTVAGLAATSGSNDGVGSEARFKLPYALAVDASGILYVADTWNFTVRKIVQSGKGGTGPGVVTTVAGAAGVEGSQDGTGTEARFGLTEGIAIDGSGNIYVSSKDAIRRIAPDMVVTTFAGTSGVVGAADGTGSNARFFAPGAMVTDAAGNVYVGDGLNRTVRKITPAAEVTTLAGKSTERGSADGPGLSARFSSPSGVGVGAGGNVYVADRTNRTIRMIEPGGQVSTLAGQAGVSGTADGQGSSARFTSPVAVAVDGNENVFVADQCRLRKISAGGNVTTLAGKLNSCVSSDGTGTGASFSPLSGVTVDGDGVVYVTENSTIRKVTAGGVVTTLAGQAGVAGAADGTGSAARFHELHSIAVDAAGNLYVADKFNSAIRRVTAAGQVTTPFGQLDSVGSSDGVGNAARFSYPEGVFVQANGDILVADTHYATIRRIREGVVSTLGGTATIVGATDGIGPQACFNSPTAIGADSAGNVYIADLQNESIRIGSPALADAATIDDPAGPAGSIRQLDTTPQTATSWEWSLIRRPFGSTAELSSTTIRNPTFTPDVADLYVFRVKATDGVSTSITTVNLLAASTGPFGPPSGLTATATGSTQVALSWTAASGATSYEIFRTGRLNTPYESLGTTSSVTHVDANAAPDTAYAYKVRALGTGIPSSFSNIDTAVTVMFVDDPLAVGMTIRAVHVTQLRTAINALATLTGQEELSFSDELVPGVVARRVHVDELRQRLDLSRVSLGLSPMPFTDPELIAGSTTIRAIHLQELRNAVK